MKYLRLAIIVYALVYISLGVFLLRRAKDVFDGYIITYFFINAFILLLGTFFERSKYKAKTSSQEGWVKTSERFVDHKSGKLVQVYFHPKTGERKYEYVS